MSALASESSLTVLAPDTSTESILDCLARHGACIVRDLLDETCLQELDDETHPWMDRTLFGKDDFTGKLTRRTGALVSRSPSCSDLIMHPRVLNAARSFLRPWCKEIQLHLAQIIDIHPGETRQALHRDRLAWGGYLPHTLEPQFNTLWAATDFTSENGATRVIPGSHLWPVERKAEEAECVQAVMSRGSVLLYTGTVVHGGGENRSGERRAGINITYCLNWLRQEENQYLSCPAHLARQLSLELSALIGYSMGDYALGYFTNPEAGEGEGILAPEAALGRRPSRQLAASIAGDQG